jgi:membrane protease YdiL (CAAX protease family)
MDFSIEKPSHIFAFILLIISFGILFILPVFTFIVLYGSPHLLEEINISETMAIIDQLILLSILILIPFIWYYLVNNLGIKKIFSRIKLVSENIDKAFLWGIITAGLILIVIFLIVAGLIELGYDPQKLSNIPDLEKLFSVPVMFFFVTVQPIGEEIFFRGFLFEKIEKFAGGKGAIFITAFLFGIPHMSYGKIFPAVLPILIGVLLGYIVYKTKNLWSSIIAHVAFNFTVLLLTYLGWELVKETALIL